MFIYLFGVFNYSNFERLSYLSLCISNSCLGPPFEATKISQEVYILFFLWLGIAICIVVLSDADRNVKANVTQLKQTLDLFVA